MPLSTNLSAAPYFDDFDQSDDYYRILFKPATAVQVREVNQLQTILQNQIEQFGDHILRSGTIIDGCEFSFKNTMPYIKILDTSIGGAAVDLENFSGLYLRGLQTNKEAYITHFEKGFESDGINLKTLYINYTDDEDVVDEDETFRQGEILEVISKDDPVWAYTVSSGGNVQAFSNADAIAVLSAIEVTTETEELELTGSFVQEERLTDASNTVSVLLTADSNFATETDENTIILRIKPDPAYQHGGSIDTNTWQGIQDGMILTSDTSNNVVKVVRSVGQGATATVVTTATGQIDRIDMASTGEGYTTAPHVSIYSIGANQSQVANLLITPQMFYQRITIASAPAFTDPIGVGYGITVSEGKIYQKGLFLNTSTQFTMVSKYSNTPDAVSVGFDSIESVVNVFTDSTLYDNASGFMNFSAPGADRLKLQPTLIVRSEVEENTTENYFPIVRFAEGKPYQQTKETTYNKLGDMIAQRTYEESGNYVLDPFAAVTQSTEDFDNSDDEFLYVVDPGHAYIGGYRIETETNFAKRAAKGLQTRTDDGQGFDIGYGNYIRVAEVGGLHSFKNGQIVSLRASAARYVTTYDGTSVASGLGGTEIGTARIRMISYETGVTGTPEATYKIYLIDVEMNAGKKVSQIRSIYAPSDGGSSDGIADIVTVPGDRQFLRFSKPFQKSLGSLTVADGDTLPPLPIFNECQIEQPNLQSLVYDMGRPAKSVTNYTYRYRSSTDGIYAHTNGSMSVASEGGANTSFPYVANLSDVEENDIILIPTGDIDTTTSVYTTVAFTVSGTTSRKVTISGAAETVDIVADFKVGDYVKDADGNIGYVKTINATNSFTIHSDNQNFFGGGTTSGSQTINRYFPADIPINLFGRSDMYANVSNDGQTMTIYLGVGINNTNPFSVVYDQEVENMRSTLTANRNCLVQVTGDDGVWPKSLGIPNVIRLRAVYNGPNTSSEDVSQHFMVDSNQNENYYGLSTISKVDRFGVNFTPANVITVEIDILEEDAHGLKIIDSYDITDGLTLGELTGSNTGIHTMEIPEFVSSTGQYYDLRDCADFRPMAVPTANITQDIACATLDPSSTLSFAGTQLKIPKPQSDWTYDIEYYLPRRDQISVKYDGSFEVSTDSFELQPRENEDKLPLYDSIVAPYPSLPEVLSEDMKNIINTRVFSGVNIGGRETKYSTRLEKIQDLPRVYTMDEIKNLENRIRALEYNQNVGALENNTKDRTIQSSIDSTLERFKFGFFVDNFENYDYSQTGDPTYSASIYEYVLQPAKGTVNVEFEVASKSNQYKNGNKVVFPFSRKRLLSQNIATYAKYIPDPPDPEIKEVCDFVTNQTNRYVGQNVARYSTLQQVWEEFTFFAADDTDGVARNVEIKFFNPVGNISYEVIQSRTPPTAKRAETGVRVWSPTQTPSSLSGAGEAIEIYNKQYGVKNSRGGIYPFNVNPWFIDNGVGNDLNIYEDDTALAPSATAYKTRKGAGKITFSYNHSRGRYITVRVHKGAPYFSFEICYPAITEVDEITDSGYSIFKDDPPPPVYCKKGTFLHNECKGNDRYTYVCNGRGGEMVGNIVRNHPSCRKDPPPPPCFYAGTLVNMADGTMKAIEEIQVGDQVMAMDGQTDTVSYVHDIPTDDRVLYILNGLVTATEAHPFLTTEGWKSANPEASKPIYESYGIEIGQLKVGDTLIGIDGEVELTSLESREENTKVYNFTTASTHTYVVEGLVTHNKTPPPPTCPPSGTFYRRECTSNHTLRVWEYTGKFRGYGVSRRFTSGYTSLADCAVRVRTTDLNNVAVCGYTPPDDSSDDCPDGEGPGYGTVPSNSGSNGDDGCIPVVDPHCPITDTGGGTPPYTGGGGTPPGYGTTPVTPSTGGNTTPTTTNSTPPSGGGYGGGGLGFGHGGGQPSTPINPGPVVGGGSSHSWPFFPGIGINTNIPNGGTNTSNTPPPSSTSTSSPTTSAPSGGGRPPIRGYGSLPPKYPGFRPR